MERKSHNMISLAFSIVVGDYLPNKCKEIIEANRRRFIYSNVNFAVIHVPSIKNELFGVTSDRVRCQLLRKIPYSLYIDWDCVVYPESILKNLEDFPDYPKFGKNPIGNLDWFLVYSGNNATIIQAADNTCRSEPGSYYTFLNQWSPRPMEIDPFSYDHQHFGLAYVK